MKVIELITALQEMDPNQEVMFDATKDDAEMFKFVSIDDVAEIQTSEGEHFVMLSCGVEHPEQNQN